MTAVIFLGLIPSVLSLTPNRADHLWLTLVLDGSIPEVYAPIVGTRWSGYEPICAASPRWEPQAGLIIDSPTQPFPENRDR